MYMRGIVTFLKQAMAGIWKAVCNALVSTTKWLWKNIIALGFALKTQCVHHLSNLFAWIVSNIKRYLVPQIIVEEYNKVEPMFANKQAGQIGRLLLITVPLTLLLVLLHLILGLWHALVAMKDKLLKRG
jgi:hypothetical protein